MASEVKDLRLGGAGRHVEIDGCYVGGHVRPANRKADRKDLRLAENRSSRRQVVVVIRERALSGTAWAAPCPPCSQRGCGRQLHQGPGRSRLDGACRRLRRGTPCMPGSTPGGSTTRLSTPMTRPAPTRRKSYFARLRRGEMGHHHRISGIYLIKYAREASWKEDHRRDSNGLQLRTVLVLVTRTGPSVDFCGYWQRSRPAA